jgi:hypothetical protein
MIAWTLAWMLKYFVLDSKIARFTTSPGSFVWWTSAKTLIWIVPAVWLIRVSGRTVREVLTRPVGGALSIFLLGLAFGYVVRNSDSVLAGILAHALNNLALSGPALGTGLDPAALPYPLPRCPDSVLVPGALLGSVGPALQGSIRPAPCARG